MLGSKESASISTSHSTGFRKHHRKDAATGRSPTGHTYGPTLMHIWATLLVLLGYDKDMNLGKGHFGSGPRRIGSRQIYLKINF